MIISDTIGFVFPTIGKFYTDFGGASHHVIVGDDVSILMNHYTRSQTAAYILPRLPIIGVPEIRKQFGKGIAHFLNRFRADIHHRRQRLGNSLDHRRLPDIIRAGEERGHHQSRRQRQSLDGVPEMANIQKSHTKLCGVYFGKKTVLRQRQDPSMTGTFYSQRCFAGLITYLRNVGFGQPWGVAWPAPLLIHDHRWRCDN